MCCFLNPTVLYGKNIKMFPVGIVIRIYYIHCLTTQGCCYRRLSKFIYVLIVVKGKNCKIRESKRESKREKET